jgi:hypothetical protein
VRLGLSLCMGGILVAVASVLLYAVLGMGRTLAREDAAAFGLMLTLLWLGCAALGAVGLSMCSAIPLEARARPLAVGGLAAGGLAWITAALLALMHANRNPFAPVDQLGFLGVGVTLLAALAVGVIVWLEYLRRVCVYFENAVTALNARLCMGVFVCFIAVDFCLGAVFAASTRLGEGATLMLLMNILGPLVLAGWLIVLTIQTRGSIGEVVRAPAGPESAESEDAEEGGDGEEGSHAEEGGAADEESEETPPLEGGDAEKAERGTST